MLRDVFAAFSDGGFGDTSAAGGASFRQNGSLLLEPLDPNIALDNLRIQDHIGPWGELQDALSSAPALIGLSQEVINPAAPNKEITLIADAEIYTLTAAVGVSQRTPATVGANRG